RVDYAGRDLVIGSSASAIYGAGRKHWEYASGFPAKTVKYFNGVVTARTSATQLTALDGETGDVLWQYTGEPLKEGLFAIQNSLLIVEQDSVKQYSLERPSKNLTNKAVLTEVAAALVDKGNLADAAFFVEKVAREIDPDYPALRMVRARLL